MYIHIYINLKLATCKLLTYQQQQQPLPASLAGTQQCSQLLLSTRLYLHSRNLAYTSQAQCRVTPVRRVPDLPLHSLVYTTTVPLLLPILLLCAPHVTAVELGRCAVSAGTLSDLAVGSCKLQPAQHSKQ
jgi:hypothetical protein